MKRKGTGNGEDLGARGHHLENDFVAKLNDRADELAVGLLQDALFFASFKERVHGLGGVIFLCGVFGLGKRGYRQQQAKQQGDGEDEVVESLQNGRDARDPEATGAGEEELGKKAVEEEDEQDELEDGADDLGRGGSACERRQ